MDTSNGNYWLNEPPHIIELKNCIIRYYPKSRHLQFCRPSYIDKAGSARPGKVFGIFLDDFIDNESALKLIREAFKL